MQASLEKLRKRWRKVTPKKEKYEGEDTRKPRLSSNWYLAILATIVIIMLIVVVSMISLIQVGEIKPSSPLDAIECPGIKESKECLRKGCHFDAVLDGPSCYMAKDQFGYVVQKVTNESDGPQIHLKRMIEKTPYGTSLEDVTFKVTYLTNNVLRFQFKDTKADRYEVPIQDEFPLLQEETVKDTENLTYKVEHTVGTETFHFTVQRTENETKLWDTSIGALLLSDQYLQIGSYLPSNNIYGLGEHAHDTLRHNLHFVSWPLFARDEPPVVPTNRKNLYGMHPFYLCLEESGKSHGVFFLNSNAMEVTFMPAPAVTFRTIGGILDFFIFVGDNPEHVIELYTSLVGKPMLPPYWSLGFQLSRYGYTDLEELKTVLERNRKAKIPQSVQHLDIEHLHDARDFTYDNESFPELPNFVKEMAEKHGLKWIIIQEPVIAADESNTHYNTAVDKELFVKRSPSWKSDMFPKNLRKHNITFGKVWSRDFVGFLDFFRNETKEWWKEQLTKHREEIAFDGIWIDMNEPANFGTNQDNPEYCEPSRMRSTDECWGLKCPDNKYENPPYNPMMETSDGMISEKTICMGSVQGDKDSEFLHYNVHSLYGWSQTQPTLEGARKATNTRSLVIPRSTYPSSGRYAGHWLGDNHSTFKDMQKSIIGILEFNMFGIPYVGADVCGFHGNASADLCKRWMQLGAFYPFYRNHNVIKAKSQDPASYGDKVAIPSRKAIERRIRLNPHLYTLLYKAHVNGGTVVRPVFYEFPMDELTWDMANQFMWGKSIMVVPILEKDKNLALVYLPEDEWWYFNETSSSERKFQGHYAVEFEKDDQIPMYVRGGSILPYGSYDWDEFPEYNNSNRRNITLYIFPKDGKASGDLFMDDGISENTVEDEAYAFYEFEYDNCKLKMSKDEGKNFNGTSAFLERVVIFKVSGVANVTGDFEIEAYESCKCATVHVNEEMTDFDEFSWTDKDGKCPDSK